ncbi:MAG: hypothetical protein GY797_19145 [Deltaproteobacteria bacterium]|nr:hypothetical protein [Deltaproteobacteria bacterium]
MCNKKNSWKDNYYDPKNYHLLLSKMSEHQYHKKWERLQKYHCSDCNAYGTLEPQSRSYSRAFRELVLRAYRERSSMRGIERIFGIARQTLARWLKEEAATLPDLAKTFSTRSQIVFGSGLGVETVFQSRL